MASSDDDRFSVRPRAPKSRGVARTPRFVSKVLRQLSASGANVLGARRAGAASAFGRGRVAAGMTRHAANPGARRVVIKSRFVVLRKAGIAAVSAHLRYIVRDGVTREGDAGQAYGPDTDAADVKAFEVRGQGDRHQFRFIVSVEEAGEIDDLHGYTRELMQQMSTDLETRLDWVAVDHWDTDNPHTHIVLRGRAAGGLDLVIAPDYMAHGMRRRASDLATEWLGPRSELEIRQGLQREVTDERFTSLDRALMRRAAAGVVDLAQMKDDALYRAMLRGRLQHLEAMGLARRADDQRWGLSSRLEPTLTAMGERGDILRTMQRALRGQPREYVLPQVELVKPVTGRIAAKGLADELSDRAYLVVDGVDGRGHYVPLTPGTNLQQFPLGGIVEVRGAPEARASDKTVANLARDGIYRTEQHVALLRRQGVARDSIDVVEAHVRRLEALRRAGIVERVSEGVWRVPSDLPERGQQYDARRVGSVGIELQLHLSIERQARALGATWLDKQLIAEDAGIATIGFGGEVREAMRQRADFLVAEGLAEHRGDRVVVVRNLLATLRERDLTEAARAIAAETGLAHHPAVEGERVSGIYRRSLLLASGRFAMLDNGMGFSLVPWRPVIEQRLGQSMTALVRGGGVSWEFGRQRGLSMG